MLLIIVCLASFMAPISARQAYEFASDAELVLTSPLSKSFSCEGRIYGYYADVENECKVFHVCVPHKDPDGSVLVTDHFSFTCGNQTVFSQESLTCTHPREAFPCEESATLYDVVNTEFGRILDEE